MKIERLKISAGLLLVVFASAFLTCGSARGEDAFLFDAYVKLDESAERAVKRAQKWIAETQLPDGSWNTPHGRNNTGVIAFATMSLMVNGSVPGEGPYGKEVGRGLQFLLNAQKESGLIVASSDSAAPMYQHALATICLAEIYGMTENPRIRTALINAVNLIVEVQHNEGGWRYQPHPSAGDISASVMQVMALRAAAESGIYVPDETIKKAIGFIKACYNAKEKGFAYMKGGGAAGFARTGAGLVCLQGLGLHSDPIIPNAVKYIMDNAFGGKVEWMWYGHYYSSVGLYHYGGDPWKTYYPKVKEIILKGWEKTGHSHDLLETSWQILILGVPFRYLPIYQR
ncbi:MAG TPA: hypothetical protein DCZ94_01695 [Lentisphaeria bacterium]|nr:MAG: hypothetical protein A2X48_21575 [Lentisphaerae bacterium GWF2_49_21]HBC85645.1 hypothetical protein [Lentisphaeria bacterium]